MSGKTGRSTEFLDTKDEEHEIHKQTNKQTNKQTVHVVQRPCHGHHQTVPEMTPVFQLYPSLLGTSGQLWHAPGSSDPTASLVPTCTLSYRLSSAEQAWYTHIDTPITGIIT